ncbi:hypothetical protein HH212_22990 [Massilia forsythiae]|uniref:RiboL-PSP-HEPN domain-containing protein n=1 Tax=Massilia forsythiae TaxID=2728020 RepID=A0A7Z2ZUG4_9BURK|nr:hypothetical protein [Massilia forsythiae]QJE02533.1 hypothetical protein HH212_22990 [Massilia forsythiae]
MNDIEMLTEIYPSIERRITETIRLSDSELCTPFDPEDSALRILSPVAQVELMREWFFNRYCDPAFETPREAAGGYLWIWGGPYYAHEELRRRFGSVVGKDVIDELVGELDREGVCQWAPARRGAQPRDDGFELELDKPEDPSFRLRSRLEQALSALSLRGDEAAMAQLPRLAFGEIISALEGYLWEAMAYWVGSDREALKNAVSNIPDLKDQWLRLGQIFDQHDAIKARVMFYLQNLAWRRWDKVALLFEFCLGIKPPSFRPFEEALAKRHDVVHRGGRDKDGRPVALTAQDARDLAAAVETFALEVDRAILSKFDRGSDS